MRLLRAALSADLVRSEMAEGDRWRQKTLNNLRRGSPHQKWRKLMHPVACHQLQRGRGSNDGDGDNLGRARDIERDITINATRLQKW